MIARPWASRRRALEPFFLVLGAAVVSASCAAPLMKLPSGPGTPVAPSDAVASIAQATAACRTVRTLTTEIAASGSAGGHRLRGRLLAGIAAPASARLEAVAPFGPPLFIFVATGDEATLLLPRDERVLEHGRPDAVLEAVAGVPLGAADLDLTLTGCSSAASERAQLDARQIGDGWRVVSTRDGDEWYLQRESPSQPWQLVATFKRASGGGRHWRAEFRDRQEGVPRSIRVTSVAENGRAGQAFDLQLALSQVEINVPLGPDVFKVQVPRSAEPITIEELKANGPLGTAQRSSVRGTGAPRVRKALRASGPLASRSNGR
jgi:hypothetical protein